MRGTIEVITPEIAKEYLKHNRKNRKVKPKTVETYARDMARDAFITTHQGIAFDTDGELLDGQHRLLAIVVSGKPVTMMVSRDVPKEAIAVTDRGVTRSIYDVMSIGANDAESNGEYKALTNQKTISALSQLVDCNYKQGAIKSGVNDVVRLFKEFSDATTSVYNEIITKVGASARAPMVSAAIAAVQCGVPVDAVSKFFYIFFKDDVSGCDDYNIQAVLNWKRQVDAAKINRVSINRRKLYLGTQNAIYHFVNNTNVQRIVTPAECRYDVEDKIKRALCIS